MAGNEKSNAGLVVGAGASVLAAIALLRSRTTAASALPSTTFALDKATTELLIAIAEQTGKIDADLLEAINAIRNVSISGGSGGVSASNAYPPNAEKIRATRLQIGALNVAYQFDDIVIPDGMELLIKGWPNNVGFIYVAESRSAATNINQSWPLIANEMVNYKIKNASSIYVSGTTVGDWVAYTVEQRG